MSSEIAVLYSTPDYIITSELLFQIQFFNTHVACIYNCFLISSNGYYLLFHGKLFSPKFKRDRLLSNYSKLRHSKEKGQSVKSSWPAR